MFHRTTGASNSSAHPANPMLSAPPCLVLPRGRRRARVSRSSPRSSGRGKRRSSSICDETGITCHLSSNSLLCIGDRDLDRAIHTHPRSTDMISRLETVPWIGVDLGPRPSLPHRPRNFSPVGICGIYRTCAAASLEPLAGRLAASPAGRSISSTVACNLCNSSFSTRPSTSAEAALDHRAYLPRSRPSSFDLAVCQQ